MSRVNFVSTCDISLTGYNPELNDRPFLEKRTMEGGFAHSPIRLNHSLSKLEHWNESMIVSRAEELANQALKIWQYPDIPQEIIQQYKDKVDDNEDELEEEEEEEEVETHKPTWRERFDNASFEVKQNINHLLQQLEKIPYVKEPHSRWLYLYLKKPLEHKNLFAIISCGKNTVDVKFRINPNTFKDNNDKIRKVAGWFFPRGTERRISLTEKDIPLILNYLEYAHTTTSTLAKQY